MVIILYEDNYCITAMYFPQYLTSTDVAAVKSYGYNYLILRSIADFFNDLLSTDCTCKYIKNVYNILESGAFRNLISI